MATDKKTIKSYDDYALKWAERMRSGKNIAHKFLEKPAMYKKFPDLKDKSVLCIGCGTGEECEHLKSLGAKSVIGIDISKGLIDFAKKSYPALEFQVMDMEKLNFADDSFDFVYSSLTMHYVKDWTKTLRGVYKILKKGGTFVFSTHHPVKWGAGINRSKEKDSFLMGYEKYESGESKVFGERLGAKIAMEHAKGHFSGSDGVKELPVILEAILSQYPPDFFVEMPKTASGVIWNFFQISGRWFFYLKMLYYYYV